MEIFEKSLLDDFILKKMNEKMLDEIQYQNREKIINLYEKNRKEQTRLFFANNYHDIVYSQIEEWLSSDHIKIERKVEQKEIEYIGLREIEYLIIDIYKFIFFVKPLEIDFGLKGGIYTIDHYGDCYPLYIWQDLTIPEKLKITLKSKKCWNDKKELRQTELLSNELFEQNIVEKLERNYFSF